VILAEWCSLGCLVFRLEFDFDVVAFHPYRVAGHAPWFSKTHLRIC